MCRPRSLCPESGVDGGPHRSSHLSIVTGPLALDGAPISGYTLIQARTRNEALEWALRFPDLRGEAVGRVREIGVAR